MSAGQPQLAESKRAREKSRKPLRKAIAVIYVVVMVGTLGLGFVLGRIEYRFEQPVTAESSAHTSTSKMLKPGPWGNVESIPMVIAPADELLPVIRWETEPTRWLFKKYSRADLAKFLDSLDLSAADRGRLLAPPVLSEDAEGVTLTPPTDLMLALPAASRQKLYSLLVGFPENGEHVIFFHAQSLEDHFRKYGVSAESVALFKTLSCRDGDYLIFSGFPALLSGISTYEEKVRCVKAVAAQNTMLLRLHITPQTDVNALANYWGKGYWASGARSLLESMSEIPGGAWTSIILILPRGPMSQLYSFPRTDNPANGPAVTRDCNWSSFNFFKDPPDANFSKGEYIMKLMKEDYEPVSGDPRYGDVVLFADPAGTVVHSAVFLADDIVYTKNGATFIHPWMLSTISELRNVYSYHLPQGQELRIQYLRQK
jgi:hypothetical protein